MPPLEEAQLKLTLYHGTDAEYADVIITDRFKTKQNRQHWLGNGVYFFTDEALAHWWTTKPSKKFGHNIYTPAIVECVFNAPESMILDLRRFIDFKYCFEQFQFFFNMLYAKYRKIEEVDIDRLRCTFFDWLFDIKQYAAIIGTFHSNRQPYYEQFEQDGSGFDNLNLAYTEVQVCIPETMQEYIIEKRQLQVNTKQS